MPIFNPLREFVDGSYHLCHGQVVLHQSSLMGTLDDSGREQQQIRIMMEKRGGG